MSKINLLSENLINQIAAGEVVERPASVVKELLENSIDAEAKKIVVEVKRGGIELIKISDDGCGMSREDALKCLERHATSKISTAEDLQKIHTMGFRGEAMASIASVSKLALRTRLKGEDSGTEILTEAGTILKEGLVGCPEGTEIEMRDLFFNTPARLKFLKSEQTEYQNIVDCLLNAAMAFPEIAFKLVKDDKIVFDLPASNDELVRLRGVLGKGIIEEMVPVFYGGVHLKITGYIGKPSLSRANKGMQYFFVNNRPINSHVLSYAIKQAYHSLLAKERHPVFVVKFELEPSMVDVNCHPRKTEVKFTDEREVYRVLTGACGKSLEENVLTPKMQTAGNYYQERRPDGLAQLSFENLASGVKSVVNIPVASVQEKSLHANAVEVNFIREMPAQSDSERLVMAENIQLENASDARQEEAPNSGQENVTDVEQENTANPLLVLGQLNNSFILCQSGENLVIVDQHAAHERIRYNKLMMEGENEEKLIQPLLVPVNVELAQRDAAILDESKTALEEIGLKIEHFGGNTFAITEVPAFLVKTNLEKVLLGMLDDVRNNVGNQSSFKGDLYGRKEKILTYLACRSSVKFGDQLSRAEMVGLIEQLESTASGKATCPHGRPTMVILEAEELWSRFGRKYTGFFEKERFKDVNC